MYSSAMCGAKFAYGIDIDSWSVVVNKCIAEIFDIQGTDVKVVDDVIYLP